ncbi:MAG: DUF4293 domain-containing protein [Prolixibacteraceae bacterium]
MIQRIQTVYLLLAGLITASLFFFDFAQLAVDSNLYVLNAHGILDGEDVIISGIPIQFFIALVSIMHVVIIFMYKKRIRQIRMTVFTIILLFGLMAFLFYFIYGSFENVSAVFEIPMSFPLIAIILDYLAIRGIGKDEALIRSMNRIR